MGDIPTDLTREEWAWIGYVDDKGTQVVKGEEGWSTESRIGKADETRWGSRKILLRKNKRCEGRKMVWMIG